MALVFLMVIALPLFTSPAMAASSASTIGTSRAKEIAVEHAGFTTSAVSFKKAKLDRDDGVYEYEINFVKGSYRYEYDIDAYSGAVLEYTVKKTSTARNTTKSMIGLEKAKEAALKAAGLKAADVTFIETKLDRDSRTNEYDISFYTDTMKYEYEIDAASAAVNEYTHTILQHTDSAPTGSTGSGSSGSTDGGTKGSTPSGSTAATGNIGIDKAKSIALAHAGVAAADVRFTKAKLDRDDGVALYEIEFRIGRVEYEYEIHATTGKILDWDIDRD